MLSYESIVICPDAGCVGCEHSKPHKWMDVESGCTEGGGNNCPNCGEVKQKAQGVNDD